MIDVLIKLTIAFISMAIFHELGHFICLKLLKVKGIIWKIPFMIEYPSNALNRENKIAVIFGGIVSGILPAFFFGFNGWGILILLAAYSCFLPKDIKRMKELGLRIRWKDIVEELNKDENTDRNKTK